MWIEYQVAPASHTSCTVLPVIVGLHHLSRFRGGQSSNAGTAATLNDIWTEYRKELEFTIHKEKTKDHEAAAPDLLSQEARLRQRLGRLNMDMDVCQGDGNCLVTAGATLTMQHERVLSLRTCEVLLEGYCMVKDAMESDLEGIVPHHTATQCDKGCVLSCAVQSHFKGAVEDRGLPQSCQAENSQIYEVRPAVHAQCTLCS